MDTRMIYTKKYLFFDYRNYTHIDEIPMIEQYHWFVLICQESNLSSVNFCFIRFFLCSEGLRLLGPRTGSLWMPLTSWSIINFYLKMFYRSLKMFYFYSSFLLSLSSFELICYLSWSIFTRIVELLSLWGWRGSYWMDGRELLFLVEMLLALEVLYEEVLR